MFYGFEEDVDHPDALVDLVDGRERLVVLHVDVGISQGGFRSLEDSVFVLFVCVEIEEAGHCIGGTAVILVVLSLVLVLFAWCGRCYLAGRRHGCVGTRVSVVSWAMLVGSSWGKPLDARKEK